MRFASVNVVFQTFCVFKSYSVFIFFVEIYVVMEIKWNTFCSVTLDCE